MAYYAREDFFHNPELLERAGRILTGQLELDWMGLDIERVRCRPAHADRGLTYEDVNVGPYGWDRIPERIRHNFSMAPRGAVLPPGLPHLGYDINRRSEVWAENAPALYEEAKSRHWVPARDLPWEAIEPLGHGPDRERALAQLYTDLTSMAYALEDLPSKWVWRINHELLELKSWLCAEMFDAARLGDAFRKRALAGGTGLGLDQPELEDFLKAVLDSGTYPCASVSGHLLLAGLARTLLAHLGAVSANPVDQALSRLGVQDLARMTSYGLGHIRQLVEARPHEAQTLAGHLDQVEDVLLGLLGAPVFFGALAVATAGDRAGAPGATERVAGLYRRFVREHLERRRAAGLPFESSPLLRFTELLEAGSD